MIKQKET